MPGHTLPPVTSEQRKLRSARASAIRYGRHEQAAELDRDFAADRLAQHIAVVVALSPPLSAEQVDRLRGLLPPTT
jgi:hypothetical protein